MDCIWFIYLFESIVKILKRFCDITCIYWILGVRLFLGTKTFPLRG